MALPLLNAKTAVIGAGVVGLAVARRLAQLGHEVIVVEAAGHIGEGISSRNSEVIHAGIYYPQGSLKARLCVAGREQLYQYCRRHKVKFSDCGKWLVATSDAQAERLAGIQAQASGNGVLLALHGRAEVEKALPELTAVAGLWSPRTGIVDSHGLMLSLRGELEDAGGQLALHTPVNAISSAETAGGRHRLTLGGAMPCVLEVDNLINSAGLGAVALTRNWQGLPASQQPQQWFARGVYFSYSGRHSFRQLVYPLPEPGGLGVHLTLDLAGQIRFGPDVEWIEREDYSVQPERKAAFVDAIRQWWPGLNPEKLQPAYAGIRPKLAGPEGEFCDFRIDGPSQHGVAGLVNLFGIESPGLTACLAIADEVVQRLDQAG
ncbi:MAG TPA: NAD(P)/FAD-dependent oxidoreductase [Marinobacter sp.]|nr:NAD(P)/FAD-dependent oxidoreductase [Marinobacter sp.]